MTIWDRACCVGYGIQARVDGLWHLARGHRLLWRADVDLWSGHTGCIVCESCPDTSDHESDLVIWCRHWWWLNYVAQFVCGVMGHAERRHPQRANSDGVWVDVESEWYCYRCMADVD